MLANTLNLTFHGIGAPVVPPAEGELKYFVSAEVFRKTIAMLDGLEAETGLRTHVTFDDGNISDYDIGLPTLLDHRRSGIFFILAGRIGAKGYVSASQIREILASGMQIGTHGHDHVDWRALDTAGRQRELIDARKKIENVTGVPVASASVPFGRFDKALLAQLKQLAYDQVFTSSTGLTYENAWFCPRRSLTEAFEPERDLASFATMDAKVRGLAYRWARRVRYSA